MAKTKSFRINEKTKTRFDQVFYTAKSTDSKLTHDEFFNILLDLYEQNQWVIKSENN